MIERIKCWIRHKLGWQTPTEAIMSIDIGKCIDDGIANFERHQALNGWVESGMIECLGKMSDDDMETMIKALTRGENDCDA